MNDGSIIVLRASGVIELLPAEADVFVQAKVLIGAETLEVAGTMIPKLVMLVQKGSRRTREGALGRGGATERWEDVASGASDQREVCDDEDGKNKRLPPNEMGTAMYPNKMDFICGDAVLVELGFPQSSALWEKEEQQNGVTPSMEGGTECRLRRRRGENLCALKDSGYVQKVLGFLGFGNRTER